MTEIDIVTAQSKAWALLARPLAAGRGASTYLLTGEEGLGHFPLALRYAALLNCPSPTERLVNGQAVSVPCGQCPSCHAILSINSEALQVVVPVRSHRSLGEAIDLTNEALAIKRQEPWALLSDASPTSIPIDMARGVKKHLMVQAAPGVHRVALFYQMDKMLPASADALLKLIEEPPSNTTVILTAANPESLLPTIQSRSRRVRLSRVNESTLAVYLTERYNQSLDRATLFARVTQGNPGRAIALATAETEDGLSPREVGYEIFKAMLVESTPVVVSQIAQLVDDRDRAGVEELIRLWESLIRDCHVQAGNPERVEMINVDFANEIATFSGQFVHPGVAAAMTDHFKKALADLRRNVHIHLLLVALALKLRACLRAAG